MWNLKNYINESICKTETNSQMQNANLWLPMGLGGGGWDKLGIWD